MMIAPAPQDAEFGLRASPNELTNLVLLLARYVGGRGQLTSNDTAEFLYPELFRCVGTIGHEMMCAAQSFDRPLGEAEYEMMDRFVTAMGQASLLCDLVDAETVGLENALRVIAAHPETQRVGIRVDSGNIEEQCVLYFEKMKQAGISVRTIVFEDEVSPEMVQKVCDHFRAATKQEPTMLFPGAGGYWWRLVHRDTVAAAFKRSATEDRPNVKFSNSPGKESLGGYLRVYAREDVLVVADASESSARRAAVRQAGGSGTNRLSRELPRPGRPRRSNLGPLSPLGIVAEGPRLPGSLPHHANARSGGGGTGADAGALFLLPHPPHPPLPRRGEGGARALWLPLSPVLLPLPPWETGLGGEGDSSAGV